MPDYLTLTEVLVIHEELIDLYGGAHGVRDMGAVESALFRPQTGYYEDVIAEAAALLESLAINHPFIDGNKRIAFAVADVFLRLNGYLFEEDSVHDLYRYLFEAFSGAGAARAEAVLDAKKRGMGRADDPRFVLGEEAVGPDVERRQGVRAFVDVSPHRAVAPYKEHFEALRSAAEDEAFRARIVDRVEAAKRRSGLGHAGACHGAFFSPPILQTSFHSSSRTGCTERRELFASTMS